MKPLLTRALLCVSVLATAVIGEDKVDYHTFLRVNPSDQYESLSFSSDYWQGENLGALDGNKDDFFSKHASNLPLEELSIETYNTETGETAYQKYKVLPQYKGRSMTWLLENVYRERITEMEPFDVNIPMGFKDAPNSEYLFCNERGLYINIFDFRDFGNTFKRFQCGRKSPSLGFDFVPSSDDSDTTFDHLYDVLGRQYVTPAFSDEFGVSSFSSDVGFQIFNDTTNRNLDLAIGTNHGDHLAQVKNANFVYTIKVGTKAVGDFFWCYAYPNSLEGAIDTMFLAGEDAPGFFDTALCYGFLKGWVAFYWIDEMLAMDWFNQALLFLLPILYQRWVIGDLTIKNMIRHQFDTEFWWTLVASIAAVPELYLGVAILVQFVVTMGGVWTYYLYANGYFPEIWGWITNAYQYVVVDHIAVTGSVIAAVIMLVVIVFGVGSFLLSQH